MTERFDCHHCSESLFGRKYILREEDPYCVKCFESLYSNTCEECKKPIGCDCKDLSYKDRHWHENCFHCFQCKNSLVDKPFAAKDEHLLCTECYSNEYSSKCSECKKTIMPGTRKMEYRGNSWHETCFICHRCQQPIGTKSFIPKDDQNFCVPCYEKQFAMQCVQCKKAITTGGVTYREQPWHKECFVCTECKKQLSGQRFTSRDEDAYCLNCFCNLYAKKCAGCTNPISVPRYPSEWWMGFRSQVQVNKKGKTKRTKKTKTKRPKEKKPKAQVSKEGDFLELKYKEKGMMEFIFI
ncbi:four and a half LIM domains protein 2 isoform X1 [Sarcophilus harrisii]|uniref:four and a half LIM domains protein 2 isoform X1 n=1 Tax=Sarcophilus harrisii TaxID=9305 RepID=UPI001301C7C1|nr:four and a half LIM domains protein 2 isoform X1 [Sarcophilus harrisii]XP_031814652.1 four and a half LIM domains protein 2 isoform X1 [Sarcophilus harrisii]XP_031814653.1 four and a half LIM domains protein 2 isoform X1 [Sarcophilus harrisii]XP_031814654.1 four and a half LIM domains protein 2 isoform X1 [Sarcophilus harrisii]XP_031814655.1 four and a half LIM domains protein 2 isoform X1 [Sarcophilus harrisii]